MFPLHVVTTPGNRSVWRPAQHKFDITGNRPVGQVGGAARKLVKNNVLVPDQIWQVALEVRSDPPLVKALIISDRCSVVGHDPPVPDRQGSRKPHYDAET